MSDPDSADRTTSLDDRLDAAVAAYADAKAAGRAADERALLAPFSEPERVQLRRLFQMVDASAEPTPVLVGSSDEAFEPPRPLTPGVRLGAREGERRSGYTLERVLGGGAVGTVWLARDESLDRQVAIKFLRPGLALEPRNVERFRREALAVARLEHPNVVQVHGVGRELGHHWFVMEYVEGASLAALLDEAARAGDGAERDAVLARLLDPTAPDLERAAARVLGEVARALAAAHEVGILHRDVKPSNILIGSVAAGASGPRVRLADFGLAQADGQPALSLTGEPLGTPYYMSPEQVVRRRDGDLDARTDVYSLGVTLYEVLTARRPYVGETVLAVFDAIRGGVGGGEIEPDVRAVRPRLDESLAAVVRSAMARERDARYADAQSLAADLDRVAAGEPSQAQAKHGGLWKSSWRAVRRAQRQGRPIRYRSAQTLLGLPLVEFRLGRVPGEAIRPARGWLAVGECAIGVVAFGNVASVGVFAGAGAVSFGLVCGWAGALAAGGLALAGGASIGGFAIAGGGAIGYVALAGGFALGWYAIGAMAVGAHTVTAGAVDPAAREFFERIPLLGGWLENVFSHRGR